VDRAVTNEGFAGDLDRRKCTFISDAEFAQLVIFAVAA
jgi:hypothetical protein